MVTKKRESSVSPHDAAFSGAAILFGMRRLLPVSLFIIPFGVAFGVAAIEQGLGPVQTTMMSFFVFTATAQFAALDFLSEPVAFVSLLLVVLVLNGRHVIMGAALSRWINRLPLGKRLTSLALLSDANFADAQPVLQKGETDSGVLLGGGLMLWLTWVGSTALGAFSGDLLGDTDAYGFGAIMVCFFAATTVKMLQGSSGLILPTIAAMAVSASTISFLPMGWNIIIAALIGGSLAAIRHAK